MSELGDLRKIRQIVEDLRMGKKRNGQMEDKSWFDPERRFEGGFTQKHEQFNEFAQDKMLEALDDREIIKLFGMQCGTDTTIGKYPEFQTADGKWDFSAKNREKGNPEGKLLDKFQKTYMDAYRNDLGKASMLPYQLYMNYLVHPCRPVEKFLMYTKAGSGKTKAIIQTICNYWDDPRPKVIFVHLDTLVDNFFNEVFEHDSILRDYILDAPDEKNGGISQDTKFVLMASAISKPEESLGTPVAQASDTLQKFLRKIYTEKERRSMTPRPIRGGLICLSYTQCSYIHDGPQSQLLDPEKYKNKTKDTKAGDEMPRPTDASGRPIEKRVGKFLGSLYGEGGRFEDLPFDDAYEDEFRKAQFIEGVDDERRYEDERDEDYERRNEERDEELKWGSLEPDGYSSDESYEEITSIPKKEPVEEEESDEEFRRYMADDDEEDEETKKMKEELLKQEEDRIAKEKQEAECTKYFPPESRNSLATLRKHMKSIYTTPGVDKSAIDRCFQKLKKEVATQEELQMYENARKAEDLEINAPWEDKCAKYFPLETRRSLPTLKKQLRSNLTTPGLKNEQSEINSCYKQLKSEIESRMEDASAWELEQAREEIEKDKKDRASQRKLERAEARQNMVDLLRGWKGGGAWKRDVPIVKSSDLNLSENSEYKRYNIYANKWEDALPDSDGVIGGSGQIVDINGAKGWFARRKIPMPDGECTEQIVEAPMVRGRELKCNSSNGLFVLLPNGEDLEKVTFDPYGGYSLPQPDEGIHYVGTLVNPEEIARQPRKKKGGGGKKASTKSSKELTLDEMRKEAEGSHCVVNTAEKPWITHFHHIVAMFDEAHNLNFKRHTDPPLSDTKNAGRQKNFWGIKQAISECVNSVCVFFTATPYSSDISYACELFRVLKAKEYEGSPQNNFFIYYNDSHPTLLPELKPFPPEVVDDETCDKFPLYLRLCSYDSIQIPKSFSKVVHGVVLSTAEITDLITPRYDEQSDERFQPPSQDVINQTVSRDMERLNSNAKSLETPESQGILRNLFGFGEQPATVRQSLAFLGQQKTVDEYNCQIDGSCFGPVTAHARRRKDSNGDVVMVDAEPKAKPKRKAKKKDSDGDVVMEDAQKEWKCRQDALTDKDLARLNIDKKMSQWNIATNNFMGGKGGTDKGKYLDVLTKYCTVEKQDKNKRVYNPTSGNKYILLQLTPNKDPIALVGMYIEVKDDPETVVGKFITTNADTRCGPESTGERKKSIFTKLKETLTGEQTEEEHIVDREHGYQCALDVRMNKATKRWELVSNNFIGMIKEIYSHDGTSEVCFYSVGASIIKKCRDFSQFRGDELEKYLQLSTQAYNYSQFPYTTSTPLKAFTEKEIQRGGKAPQIKHRQAYDPSIHDAGKFAYSTGDDDDKKKAFNELLDYFGQIGPEEDGEYYFDRIGDYKGKTLHIEYAPMLSQLIVDLYINVKLLERKAFVFVSGKQMIWPMIRLIRKYLFNEHCDIYKKKEENSGRCYLKLKKDNVNPIGDPDKKTNLSVEAFGMSLDDLRKMTLKEPCKEPTKEKPYCPRKTLNVERTMKLLESKTISYWNKDLEGESAAIMVVDIDTYSTGVSLQTTRDMYFFSIPKNWERLKQALGRPARTCRYEPPLPEEKREIYAHMYVPVYGLMNGKLPINVPVSPGAMLLNKVNRERRAAEMEAIETFAKQHIGLKCDHLFGIRVPSVEKCNPERENTEPCK